MRFLVDEMPETQFDCHFLSFGSYYAYCGIPTYSYGQCYMEKGLVCPYLAKGVIINELAGEEDGEKATGETADPDLA